MAKRTRFQRTQFHGSDAHAFELLDQPPEMLEHHADLVLPAFEQPHFIPGILGTMGQFQARGRGALSFDGHTLAKAPVPAPASGRR